MQGQNPVKPSSSACSAVLAPAANADISQYLVQTVYRQVNAHKTRWELGR